MSLYNIGEYVQIFLLLAPLRVEFNYPSLQIKVQSVSALILVEKSVEFLGKWIQNNFVYVANACIRVKTKEKGGNRFVYRLFHMVN